jgi:hypothetical protein
VYNNVLLGRGQPMISVSAESDIVRSNVSDCNLLWWLSDEGTGLFETPGGAALGLAEWQAARKLDANSRVMDPRVEVKNGRWARLPGSPSASGGKRLTAEDLRAFFAVKPMPEIPSESGSSSIRDPKPPTEAFLRKVTELLGVPEGEPVPIGPIAHDDGAATLPIANADFENPTLPANGTTDTVAGWTAEGTTPLIWHAADTGLWNWYMPSGSNILVLPPGEGDCSVSQELTETLRPDMRYRISVWAGQRIDQAALPWPRIALELRAGERLLNSVDIPDPMIKPHHGIWVETALVYTSPHETSGQPLRIVIRRKGSARLQACFDEVTLTATRG